jgi:uncharacterized phage protein (TIGR01671 family)
MREILFRGKDTQTGKWRYSMSISRQCYDDDEIYTCYIGAGYNTVDAKTVGQFTGLYDKNGTKIFEGDIIAGAAHWLERMKNGVVAFKDGSFGLIWYRGNIEQFNAFTSMCNVEYEVIGNIHDNPELLKGGDAE